ncbi:hypothetical protein DIC66_01450 [Rhodoferax lacus]|uniref:Translocation and assembly module TamB C-terminal domain-containing protein n=1 Tax=Rhodoferax lacus TaxID=2184758 RepID=A0A3E1RGU5_9BURK|nr:translocation/assembly module TamB domain-containing protein [Rhodoferax lacus]RFO98579.1 hypothetical protein DIC66_01450 [Rhodoferax lacus]
MQRLRHFRPLFHALGAGLSLLLTAMAVTLVGLVLGLWLWVRSEGSMEHALRLAGALLPTGQSLQASDVSGSLRDGGKLAHLAWKQGDLTVELQGVELAWDWHGLLDGALRVGTLHAQRLHIEDRRPASQSPMAELVLPLQMDVQFAVDHVEWVGPPALQLESLRGRYRYDGQTHFLQDASVQMAAGSYQGQAQLQARSPMAASVQVQGTVQTPVKIQQAPLSVAAEATAQGTLMGPHAQLKVDMSLQPAGEHKTRPLGAMQATLQALLKPSEAQPLASAQAQWSALDLSTLWPQAPQTRLSGQAQVAPDGKGWRADVLLQNALEGTLDHQRLPLRAAHANVLYRDGQWMLSALQAALAGGTLQAQGSYGGSPATWSAQGSLQGIEPVRIDSRWQLPTLQGTVSAKQSPQGIAFDTRLNTPLKGTAAGQEASLQAKGHWKAPLLQLDTLELHTPQAQLAGQLQVDTQSYASAAHLRASMPGAAFEVDGQAAAAAGQGSSALHISDAHALLQWLATLPLPVVSSLSTSLGPLEAQGAAELTARWSGGWQHLGADMQWNAALQSQRLDIQERYLLRDLQLDVAGTLRSLALQLRGKAQAGATQVALEAQSHVAQVGEGQWHALLDTLQLKASNALYAKPWTMDLQQPVALDWRRGALQQSFTLADGALRLGGPAPGVATIQWQPVQWTHQGAAGNASPSRWSTRGQLQGLPLAWLELLGQTQLANLGLRGDLLFGGQWDASGGEALRVRASLRRSSGDLQLLAGEQAGGALPAGLRDAHVDLEIDNDALRANLVWASDAGGNAQADFSTRLQTVAGSTRWAPDAPLQAKVHASLPKVGAWSLVAPVGWRIQGTLDADATLGGTRANPAWKGSVEARDMSVRSVVDGLDFSQGTMRLAINGQHLEIAELTLLGAGGAAGGRLQISGSADWLPGTATPAAKRLRMALEAKAQSFRVSARPDQRLVVSGNLSAQLNQAKLLVRGALVADQALFVLPDDSTPKLGADVVVVRKLPAGKTKPLPAAPAPRLASTVVPDISITLDPGSNFQLQGHGINTRLAGLVTLKAEGLNATPRLVGELHTVSGTYRAYGQNLNIEEGTLRFSGAYDNPALNIRALRPNLQQEVGVQISGTAQLPVVRLYSDPELSDADKLSWLVLGHASTAGGAETAMLQQAALALLSGNGKTPTEGLINAFGLDEVSLGQTATTNLDGSTGTQATVKLGKRISRDFYVAYERSLAGTLGTLYIFYDLSRRFTLRAESGAQSAVDLIFTTRFD